MAVSPVLAQGVVSGAVCPAPGFFGKRLYEQQTKIEKLPNGSYKVQTAFKPNRPTAGIIGAGIFGGLIGGGAVIWDNLDAWINQPPFISDEGIENRNTVQAPPQSSQPVASTVATTNSQNQEQEDAQAAAKRAALVRQQYQETLKEAAVVSVDKTQETLAQQQTRITQNQQINLEKLQEIKGNQEAAQALAEAESHRTVVAAKIGNLVAPVVNTLADGKLEAALNAAARNFGLPKELALASLAIENGACTDGGDCDTSVLNNPDVYILTCFDYLKI